MFSHDLSGDGYDDILMLTPPGGPAFWFENPRRPGSWPFHLAFPRVDTESPHFTDVVTANKKGTFVWRGR